MSDLPKSLTRSLGVSFWIGYAVTPVVAFTFLATMQVLDDGLAFWLFVCVILGMVAPAGGSFFQAIHDLFIARRTQQLRVWDIALMAAICVAFIVAGYISLRTPGKDRAVHIAAVFVGILILIYARRRRA